MKTRMQIHCRNIAIVLWLIALLFALLGCSSGPTGPSDIAVTPMGITVENTHLLVHEPGWATTIDAAWAAAQDCYGVTKDGGLITVRVKDCHDICGDNKRCWQLGDKYVGGTRFHDTVKVCQDLAAIEHEFRHITEPWSIRPGGLDLHKVADCI